MFYVVGLGLSIDQSIAALSIIYVCFLITLYMFMFWEFGIKWWH